MAEAISSSGMSRSKMVFGVPFYGRGWLLKGLEKHGLGAPAMSPVVRSNHTKDQGVWAFYEICQRIITDQATNVFDEKINSSYAYTLKGIGWWIAYNDEQTIRTKVISEVNNPQAYPPSTHNF